MNTARILLIDPGSSRREINEPIGVAALTGALEGSLGARVRVRQHFVSLDGHLDLSMLEHFDLVGLTTSLGSLQATREVATHCASLPPSRRPVLVLGGLLATFAPEALLAQLPSAAEPICVRGEGEEALVGLVRGVLDEGRDSLVDSAMSREVPNLVLQVGGGFHHSARRNIGLDNAVAPRRSHVPLLARSGGIVRTEASRGCSYGRCSFCAIQEKYCGEASWRPVPVERVVDELVELSSMGARHPYYTDEDFVGSDPQRAMRLAGAISEAKADGRIHPDLSLYLDLRVASVLQVARPGRPSGELVLGALKAAGLREVFVGIESGAKEQVRRFQKAASAERNLRALELLLRMGLAVDVGFIMFDPEMQLEELRHNLDFLRASGLWTHDARLTKSLRLQTGTPQLAEFENKGLVAGPLDLDDLTYPYRWLDPRAEAVHNVFRAWERQVIDDVYLLQSATRGEVPCEEQRRFLRAVLGQIRAAEHGALDALVAAAVEGREPAAEDLDRFSRVRERWLEHWMCWERGRKVA